MSFSTNKLIFRSIFFENSILFDEHWQDRLAMSYFCKAYMVNKDSKNKMKTVGK